MSKLDTENLTVESFETVQPVGVSVNITKETENEPRCYSPLCAPTFWKTCEPCQPEG